MQVKFNWYKTDIVVFVIVLIAVATHMDTSY